MSILHKAFLRGVFGVFALGVAGAAGAQGYDQPVNWSGPYVGVEGGAGWGSSRHADDNGFDSGDFQNKGGLVGGEVGYNWQLSQIVFGVEGDMSWSDIAGRSIGGIDGTCGGDANPNCRTRLDDLGTVRGRVGLAIGPFLPYATGGLAFGEVQGGEGNPGDTDAFGSGSTYRTGWTAGAGVEMAVTQQLSAKLEYLHVDLGDGPVFTDTFSDGSSASESVNFHTDIVRAGVAFRF